jgi:citrate lyase subunit beta/citryl-CoA lyase
MMFVPGHNQRLLKSASKSEADALILDIEDSVRPEENKALARKTILDKIQSGTFDGYSVFARINDRESGHLLEDVTTLTISGIDGFVYPKAMTGQDIYFFSKLLETIEYQKGLPLGTFNIVPLIETASAVLHAEEICRASERVIAIAYGCEDFITDLEGIHDREGSSLFVPRAMIAMAARAAGVIPIDTVHIDVHDLDHLEKNLQTARKLGFEGMLVLHPNEIPLVHKYFSPSEGEVERASKMLQLAKEAEAQGKGVAVLDGEFIGPPMVAAAKKTLARHTRIQEKKS